MEWISVKEKTKGHRLTQQVIDKDTGELIDEQNYIIDEEETKTFKKTVKKEQFYFIYADLLQALKDTKRTTRTALAVFACIVQRYNYSEGIGLVKGVKDSIAEELNLSLKTINRCIKELVDDKYLIRKSQSFYFINPKYVFKGSIENRKKIIIEIEELM
jgi:hypothetical protein